MSQKYTVELHKEYEDYGGYDNIPYYLEVIHVHFDKCPVCEEDYPGLELVDEPFVKLFSELSQGDKVVCENCRAVFLVTDYIPDDDESCQLATVEACID